MIIDRLGRTCRRSFVIIFTFYFITFVIAFGNPRDSAAMGQTPPTTIDAFPAPADQASFKSTPPVLLFYHVRNGKVHQSVFSLADLTETAPVIVDGYVAGILVFCENEMDILAAGSRLRKLTEDADGTLNFDYFGRLNPKKFWNGTLSDAGFLCDSKRVGDRQSTFKKYALFPKTILDTVSIKNKFKILFMQDGKNFELAVHHNGYQDFPPFASPAEQKTEKTAFRYLGNRAAAISSSADFEKRMAAIAEGIALVERTFGMKLVHFVNLVDYEGVENAVTRMDRNDIWFFIDTLRHESVAELKTIATHETLHLLVDRYRFTQAYPVRELFAELKGYGEFSAERFLLLTRGAVINDANSGARAHLFFTFVNERNFLDRKGGHSQDNLDEFCTSFLHSLLFISLIERNLNLPLISNAHSGVGRLSDNDRSEILDYYLRSIRAFLKTVSRREVEGRTNDFLEKKHAYIDSLMHTPHFSMSAHPGPS